MTKTKAALIYGSITSGVMIIFWFVSKIFFVDENGKMDYNSSEIAGFAAMFLSLAAVFVGVKTYRDKEKGGFISFKEAFLTGFYIVLVASVVYVVGWMIYYPFIATEFADQYMTCQIENYQKDGLSASEIQIKTDELEEWMVAYENPLFRMGMTFLEFFPIGLIGALLFSFFLKKKQG